MQKRTGDKGKEKLEESLLTTTKINKIIENLLKSIERCQEHLAKASPELASRLSKLDYAVAAGSISQDTIKQAQEISKAIKDLSSEDFTQLSEFSESDDNNEEPSSLNDLTQSLESFSTEVTKIKSSLQNMEKRLSEMNDTDNSLSDFMKIAGKVLAEILKQKTIPNITPDDRKLLENIYQSCVIISSQKNIWLSVHKNTNELQLDDVKSFNYYYNSLQESFNNWVAIIVSKKIDNRIDVCSFLTIKQYDIIQVIAKLDENVLNELIRKESEKTSIPCLLNMPSLLIMPPQRPTRYFSFLEELQKYNKFLLEGSESTNLVIDKLSEKFKRVADKINTKIKPIPINEDSIYTPLYRIINGIADFYSAYANKVDESASDGCLSGDYKVSEQLNNTSELNPKDLNLIREANLKSAEEAMDKNREIYEKDLDRTTPHSPNLFQHRIRPAIRPLFEVLGLTGTTALGAGIGFTVLFFAFPGIGLGISIAIVVGGGIVGAGVGALFITAERLIWPKNPKIDKAVVKNTEQSNFFAANSKKNPISPPVPKITKQVRFNDENGRNNSSVTAITEVPSPEDINNISPVKPKSSPTSQRTAQ